MITKRWIAIGIISVGFGSTVIAGFLLAMSDLTILAVLGWALGIFVVVAPLLVYGIYLYVNSDPPEPIHSDTERQLQLMDLLNQEGVVSVQMAAERLGIDVEHIFKLLQDLETLDLFGGYVDHETSIIYASPEDRPRLS